MNVNELSERLLKGERRAAARLISWAEREDPRAFQTLKSLYQNTGQAHLIGITGPPGSGKSTLLLSLIKLFSSISVVIFISLI